MSLFTSAVVFNSLYVSCVKKNQKVECILIYYDNNISPYVKVLQVMF